MLSLIAGNANLNSTNGFFRVANTAVPVNANGLFARIQPSSVAGSGLTMLNSGRVGLGTLTPNCELQLGQSASNRKIVLFEGTNNDHQFYGFGINASTLRYQVDNIGADHIWYAGTSATTSNELMRIKGNGRLGIGTTNPSEKLDVAGNARISAMPNAFGNATYTNFVVNKADGTLGTISEVNANFWRVGGNTLATAGTGSLGTISNTDLRIIQNNITFIRKDNTTVLTGGTPIQIINTTSGASSIGTQIINNSTVAGNYNLIVQGGLNSRVDFMTDGRVYFRGNSVVSPVGWSGTYMFAGATGYTNLAHFKGTASNDVMVLKDAGNVGIGTTNPITTLQVNGGLALKSVRVATAGYTALITDHTIHLVAGASGTITIPSAGSSNGRIILFANDSGTGVNTSIAYRQTSGVTTNSINGNQRVTIQSDGTEWFQINQ